MSLATLDLLPVTSESGNIKAAGFSADDQTLVVQFASGKKYAYSGFEQNAWEPFKATFDSASTSTGKYFNAHIKNAYPARPL